MLQEHSGHRGAVGDVGMNERDAGIAQRRLKTEKAAGITQLVDNDEAGVGVLERVLFTGHLSHDELPLYLHLSDIFVRPSRSEGMGNVFIEAMAAGLPVIGTPVGGITDFLFDPDRTKLGKVTPTGLFCDVDDPASIARAAIRLVEDEALRERIVESGSAMVREKYDWDALARAMHERVLSVGTPRAER